MLQWFSLLRIENPNVLAFRVHVAVAVVQSSQHKIRYKCIEAEIRLLCFAIFSLRILVVLCLLRCTICTMCTWTLPLAIACITVSTAFLPWQISSDGKNSRHLYCVLFCYPKTYNFLSISYWRWRRGRGTHCCLLFGWFQSETKRYRKHCFTWNGRVEMSKNFWCCSFRVYLMKPTHWRRREMKKKKIWNIRCRRCWQHRRCTDRQWTEKYSNHMRAKMKIRFVSVRICRKGDADDEGPRQKLKSKTKS